MWTRMLAACAAALMTTPAVAETISPAGMWETGPKDVRLEFQLCGANAQKLCAWLRYAYDQSPRVQRYLNQLVLEEAERVGPRSWKGTLILSGFSMYGTMVLAEENRMAFDGCVALIICGEFNLYRAE